jgi:hypothetical protein
MWSSWDRLKTVSTYGPPGSEEDNDPDSGWDFSGLRDPGAMRDFMTACDYCLSGCSDDGHSLDDESCGPSRECFHVDLGGRDEGNHLGMPEDDDPPRPASRVDIPRELAVVPVPAGVRTHSSSESARCKPSSTRKQGNLCSSGKTSSRSGQAEHSPEKCIIGPGTSSAVSLMMPGQGCPRPPAGLARIWLQQQYYSEQCQSHPPPRGGVSRENSRISWRMPRSDGPKALPPEGKGAPWSIAQRLPDSCGRPRSTPGARGTPRLQPQIASAMSTTTATIEPASTRRCAEATTPGVGDATTVRRIGAPRPNRQGRGSSVGPYDGHHSRPGSGPRLPSPSTRGKQGRSCGLRTTGWHASWEERTTTTSSSVTSSCSSPTPPGPGWSISLLRRSPTGTTWSRPSLETSKVRTYALGTPGISEAAAVARGISARVHPVVFEAAHRAAQRHRLGCHRGIPRRHHLPRPSEQTGAQDSHQGERIDGHRHQVCLWSGGGRSHLLEGQAASGTAAGRRPRGVHLAWHKEEGQEEVASEARRRRRRSCRCCRAREPSEASRRGQPVRQDAQGVMPLSLGSRQAHP